VSENETTLIALDWMFDSATYSYSAVPYEGATVVDESGAVLGLTDYNGNATFSKTEGVVKIEGAAAIHLGEVVSVGNVNIDKVSVNITVNIDGKTEVLAEIVTVSDDLTVDEALIMAHVKFLMRRGRYELKRPPHGISFFDYKVLGNRYNALCNIKRERPLGGGENAALAADNIRKVSRTGTIYYFSYITGSVNDGSSDS
jgi:hypothetical protein